MGLKQLFSLLAGLALISVASPSDAFDYKTYPGSLCQPVSGPQAVDFTKFRGIIINASQESRGVTCPIIRDRVPHEGQPGERTQLDIGVWFSNSTGRPVECTFVSIGENGNLVYESSQSTDPTPLIQTLYWAVSPEQTATDGTYSIDCILPPNALLLRYVAGEDNETDNGF